MFFFLISSLFPQPMDEYFQLKQQMEIPPLPFVHYHKSVLATVVLKATLQRKHLLKMF